MKLKAKDGINGVGVGGNEYAVDKNGFVDIPDEFVPAVLDAGFVMAQGDDAPAPSPAPTKAKASKAPAAAPAAAPAPSPAPAPDAPAA